MMVYGSAKVSTSSSPETKGVSTSASQTLPIKTEEQVFLGQKGISLDPKDGLVSIPVSEVSDGLIHYYNYSSESEAKTIFFFIIQASDGTYRAAANACEVCFGAKKGFVQEGESVICENCGQAFLIERVGLEKGGCNPAPIDSDVLVEDGQLVIETSALDEVAYLF